MYRLRNTKPNGQLRAVYLASLLALTAPSALATDFWVDAAHGDDSNPGTSADAAWRTLPHAFDTVRAIGEGHRIFVLPGTYHEGPSFLTFPPETKVYGTSGPDATFIVGRIGISGDLAWSAMTSETVLSGFTIEAGTPGYPAIGIGTELNQCRPVLEDLRIRDSWRGVSMISVRAGRFAPVLRGVRVENCELGFWIRNAGDDSERLRMEDCSTTSCGTGLHLEAEFDSSHGYPGFTSVELRRCRLGRSTGSGVHCVFENRNTIRLRMEACEITRNQLGGITAERDAIQFTDLAWEIRSSTIAGNDGPGLQALEERAQDDIEVTVFNSILHDNVDDIVEELEFDVSWSVVSDGDFVGQDGNIAVVPRFVDAPNGDYRLRHSSPLVDRDAPGADGLDLAGRPRTLDGDLDLIGAADTGAFEHATLDWRSQPATAQELRVELWGEDGQPSVLYFNRAPLGSGVTTPFGTSYLAGPAWPIGRFVVDADHPPVLTGVLPPTSVLSGMELSFQALTGSVGAPRGAAWTNPLHLSF